MITTHATAEGPTDRAAVEALARDYRSVLLRYFDRRAIPQADLEDAVQEVFARLLRRDGDAPIETIESYLFQTAASVAPNAQVPAWYSAWYPPFCSGSRSASPVK